MKLGKFWKRATVCALLPAVGLGLAHPAMAYDATYFAFGPNWYKWNGNPFLEAAQDQAVLGVTSSLDVITSPNYFIPTTKQLGTVCYFGDTYQQYVDTHFNATVNLGALGWPQAPAGHPTSRMKVLLVDITNGYPGDAQQLASFDDTMTLNTDLSLDFSLTNEGNEPYVRPVVGADGVHYEYDGREVYIALEMDSSLSHSVWYAVKHPITYTKTSQVLLHSGC
jgi:hypothetical protein